MLALTRKSGDSIDLVLANGDEIHIQFVLRGDQIRVGIDAPHHVRILRSELNGGSAAE